MNAILPEAPTREDKTVSTLLEAMPYIQSFWGSTIVIKYGGAAMTSRRLQAEFARDIVMLKLVGMRPIVVHGGGPQVTEMLHRLGMDAKFVRGHRVTDQETMEVAKMVLIGKVNKDLVGLVHRHGGTAVGLSGEDGQLSVENDSGSTVLTVDEAGNLGMSGLLSLWSTDSPGTCDGTTTGTVYFDATENEPCFCNGTNWVQFDEGSFC